MQKTCNKNDLRPIVEQVEMKVRRSNDRNSVDWIFLLMNRMFFFHLFIFNRSTWKPDGEIRTPELTWNIYGMFIRACAVAPVIDAGRESFYD